MKRYEVTIRVPGMPPVTDVLRAPSAQAAYERVRDSSMHLRSGRGARVTVRRVGKTKVFATEASGGASRELRYYRGGPEGPDLDDGTAGVREPRRPRPSPSSMSAALPLPRELQPDALP
ncbi:MAG: hypothetical protein V9G08_05845 [Dermatophilaceae bacterium]